MTTPDPGSHDRAPDPLRSANPAAPQRGFPIAEFEARTARAQDLMLESHLDALLLTTEPEVRYFSGFHTQFWHSPTRPWFLVVPAAGKPVAVIPEIGAHGMAATWLDDIRTWPAPRPEDDGVSLLADLLNDLATRWARIGVPLGHQSHVRMPGKDFTSLLERLLGTEVVDASSLVSELRNVKSPAEIAKIRHICELVSNAFETLPQLARSGQTERELSDRFRVELLTRGADTVPYLVPASGSGGYSDIIMGPTDRTLAPGDLLSLDTGATFDGYFCDFNRNVALGAADDATRRTYDVLFEATETGFAAARPGARVSDLWNAIWNVLEAGGAQGTDTGRLGHGLGMQLTEGPSLTPTDHTLLLPGMVLTLEPGMTIRPGKQMVHEEDIVITEDGAQWLTRRAPARLPVTS